MKKLLMIVIFAGLALNTTFADSTVHEKPDVKIIVEGEPLQLDKEVPIIVNNRTLVPLRKLLVGLGVPDNAENIEWIGSKKQVKVSYNGIKIELSIDNENAYLNGKKQKLDAAPIVYRDRTYLPARFVGEALGYTINWDQYTPAVLVTSNTNNEKITQIFNDMKEKLDNVRTYEVFSKEEGQESSNIQGKINNINYTSSSLEKADLAEKIIYTEVTYEDKNEKNINYSYYTPTVFYNCYKYVKDNVLHNTGWEVWDYSSQKTNIFDDKSKTGLFNFDKTLYGDFVCKEYQDSYSISTVSNNASVLKLLGCKELYEKTFMYDTVTRLKFNLTIDKTTKLPTLLTVELDMETNQDSMNIKNKIKYSMEYINYNENVNLVLPKP